MMERPAMRVSGPTFDAADPLALADFYERLLGWPIIRQEGPRDGQPDKDGWAILRRPDGGLKIEIKCRLVAACSRCGSSGPTI